MRNLALVISLAVLTASVPAAVLGQAQSQDQGTGVSMGGFGYRKDLPVEATSDSLDVNNTNGTAIFTGHVIIAQGDMRLSAPKVVVEYSADAEGKNHIDRVLASGGVTLVSATEQAEAKSGIYDVNSGNVTLTGDVLATQGPTVVSGDKMIVNLESGKGNVTGNVRTVLNPQDTKKK